MFVRVSRLFELLAIACASIALALPAAAAAEVFEVKETTDAADAATDGVCDTVAGGSEQCTLRAAVEESNATAATKDEMSTRPRR